MNNENAVILSLVSILTRKAVIGHKWVYEEAELGHKSCTLFIMPAAKGP